MMEKPAESCQHKPEKIIDGSFLWTNGKHDILTRIEDCPFCEVEKPVSSCCAATLEKSDEHDGVYFCTQCWKEIHLEKPAESCKPKIKMQHHPDVPVSRGTVNAGIGKAETQDARPREMEEWDKIDPKGNVPQDMRDKYDYAMKKAQDKRELQSKLRLLLIEAFHKTFKNDSQSQFIDAHWIDEPLILTTINRWISESISSEMAKTEEWKASHGLANELKIEYRNEVHEKNKEIAALEQKLAQAEEITKRELDFSNRLREENYTMRNAESKLAAKQEALEKFGMHEANCDYYDGAFSGEPTDIQPCNCGFDLAKEKSNE